MRVTCIADEDTVRGFSLAGITGQVATAPREASDALQLALAQPDIGIIILTEQVTAGIRDEVEAVRLGRDRPLIVEIPGPGGPGAGHKGLRQSVQEAIGIPVDFQEAP